MIIIHQQYLKWAKMPMEDNKQAHRIDNGLSFHDLRVVADYS